MNFIQTTNVNPNASYDASRVSRASGQVFALLLCPAIMLIFGLIMIGHMIPIYSGVQNLDYTQLTNICSMVPP
jgi:hypothetical protein